MKVKLGGNFNEVPDSKPAPVGLYTGKIAAVDERDSNNGEPMIEVRWDLVGDAKGKGLKDPKSGKKAAYDPVFTYHPLDPDASWARRMKELLNALGVKLTGTVDIKTGAKALLRLKEDTGQDGEYRPNVAKIMKLGADTASDEEEDDEVEEAEEAEDEADEEEEGVDLDELSRKELLAINKEQELGLKTRSLDDDALREAIRAALSEDEEEEEEAEEEEEEEDDDTVDLSEYNRSELKKFKKDNDLDIKITTKMSDDDIRAAIAEALGSDEEEEDEEEGDDDEDGDNYDDLEIGALKQECKDRELPDTGKKSALIARLRKDDQEEPV